MITINSHAHPDRLPERRAGTVRIASIDVEWTKNYRIKNGNRPFCYSIVWLDLPSGTSTDLSDVPYAFTSVYVEDPAEKNDLVASAAATLRAASDHADLITGHQLCADLAVLDANAPHDDADLTRARAYWKQRRTSNPDAVQYVDTRYDAGHLLTGTSRQLVDVCTELGLDVTQPELRGTSMPALHRRWTDDADTEGRERVSVLNLRHSLSTAYVAARTEGLGHWGPDGLNVNRVLSHGANGAWGWLTHPTFTKLLEGPCRSATAPLSPSKAHKQPARRRSSTH
ncbi:hypothetical protein [Streptomyces katsurahamanus]|uniref:Uncharacterized protein n=1 Tax=Streptomyces katsurahamanus TaxID=2577098 RepID=A0ABW9NR58_9ACTN|nr:hypothetical protein [Streptomyces katsurahamanus]MQS35795.1 hypothetical protein [Streptomyces katsurahamanus]